MQNSEGSLAKMAVRRGSAFAAIVKYRRIASGDAGSALAEMSLGASLIFAMFFGIFQVCLGSYASHYVADAAREGARYAIVHGSASCANTSNRLPNCGASTATIVNYVKGLQYPGIVPANLTVVVTYLTGSGSTTTGSLLTTWATCSSGTCNAPGNMVNVKVTYAFPLAIPFAPSRTISVTSTSQMVVQQ